MERLPLCQSAPQPIDLHEPRVSRGYVYSWINRLHRFSWTLPWQAGNFSAFILVFAHKAKLFPDVCHEVNGLVGPGERWVCTCVKREHVRSGNAHFAFH